MPLVRPSRLAFIPAALGLALLAAPHGFAACLVSDPPADRDGNGTPDVRIVGTSTKQRLELETRNDGSYAVRLDCNGDNDFADPGDFNITRPGPVESFVVELGAGADSVLVSQADDFVNASRNVLIASGGATTIVYDANGHGLSGSNLSLEIEGGAGADVVTIDFDASTIAGSSLSVRGDLAAGNDVFSVIGAAAVSASDVDIAVALGVGFNTAGYDDAGGVVTGSIVNVNLLGGDTASYADTIRPVFSGQLAGGSRVAVNTFLGDGHDVYTASFDTETFGVDTAAPAGSSFLLYTRGDAGLDNLRVRDLAAGSPVVNGFLEINLDGGLQPDNVVTDWNGLAGSGTFKLRQSGGDALDFVLATVVTSPGSSNVLDLAVQGNAEGDFTRLGDVVYLSVQDNGTASLGPAGYALVDGGADGDDYCVFFGDVAHQSFNCEAGS